MLNVQTPNPKTLNSAGAAEDAAAEEAAQQHPLTGHGADALPAQPAAPRLEREFLRFRNIPGPWNGLQSAGRLRWYRVCDTCY
jgi:hypothetical protein